MRQGVVVMATRSERSGTERRAAQLDALCGLVADAGRLEQSGRFDAAVVRWSRDLSTPAQVILLVEEARRELRASRRRDEVLERVALTAVTEVGERLVREALTDPLTGLASRARMEDEVQHLLALSLRGGRPLTAVLLDVDGLKRLNDTEGHAAGDAALAEVGRAVREHLRKTDRAYRWGGDEFLLLMNADLDDTSLVVERIRQSCATSLSFGAAVHTGGADPVDVATWLSEADADLYRRRHSARAVIPVQTRRGSHLHPARQAALSGLAAAAAVAVGWTGLNAASHATSGREQTPSQAAAAPRNVASVVTPVVSAPQLVSVAPAKTTRTTRPATSAPAAPTAPAVAVPALHVPAVEVPAVEVPTATVPPVELPSVVPAEPSATSTSLVPRLVDGVRGVLGSLRSA
jgi:diguanylate cyclase (GGDEF)-like protein